MIAGLVLLAFLVLDASLRFVVSSLLLFDLALAFISFPNISLSRAGSGDVGAEQ
jgi:hypothetical protein